MSGNGSTFSEFKSDSVLPTEIPTAASSGEVLNGMKSTEMPPVQENPVQPAESMTGGRRRKSSKKSRRAKQRKSASKKNRSKKHGSKKHRSKK